MEYFDSGDVFFGGIFLSCVAAIVEFSGGKSMCFVEWPKKAVFLFHD